MKIKKALSPDEKTMLNNCMTMLQEIAQANAGEEDTQAKGDDTEDMNDDAANKDANQDATGTDTKDDKKKKKADGEDDKKEKSENSVDEDGGSASDDAEERIDGVLPDSTIAGQNEAQKALATLLKMVGVAAPVAKAKAPVDPNLILMKSVVEQLSVLSKQNQNLEASLSAVLEGIGISEKSFEQLEKAKSEKTPVKKSQAAPEETLEALSEIVDTIIAKKAEKKSATVEGDTKSLTKSLLRGLTNV